MSSVFVPQHIRGNKGPVTQETVQKLLDENSQLIQCIADYQSKGKVRECAQYQQILHRNLVWLATVADSNQSNVQGLMSQNSPKQGPGKSPNPLQSVAKSNGLPDRSPVGSASPQSVSSSATPPAVPSTSNSVNSGKPAEATASQPQPVQVYSQPTPDQNVPLQSRSQHQPQYTQQQQMQQTYHYPPASYGQSPLPHRSPLPPHMRPRMEHSPQMQQQAPATSPMPPYSQGMMPPYSQQGGSPRMMPTAAPSNGYPPNANISHHPHPPPANYPMTTSHGMPPQHQQHYPVSSNHAMMPDHQRQMPHYGRPGVPPNQQPSGYPPYSTQPSQHMPQYQQQPPAPHPQHPDYSQYNNQQQQQVLYQQYTTQ